MSKKRQQQHAEELRSRILAIAQQIILEEGLDAVSIRRLATELDYSVPVIYYHFRDKSELLSCAIREGYRNILNSVKQPEPGLPPDEDLRVSFKYFIESAMLVPRAYKSFILNVSSELLAESSVIGDGGEEQSPTLAKIISTLEAGIKVGLFAPCDVKLTAKACWSAMFGLFFRLIVEPDIPVAERDMLIQRHLDIMLKGISA
ncbi:MAG: TetR/AcrR family transcriptional regulator [Clostridiales bacterium]|jgi:AcrR family transcriptional regulator|nr:TetR/AcrR family transcriptional regulator [Clostridiales bacterium]